MILETERLKLHIASREEMEDLIARQTDAELLTAYREMLQGCIDHPDEWVWYAVWMIEKKDGTTVGDLSFKGLGADGTVEIGYGIEEAYRNKGFATEAVRASAEWALRQPEVSRVEAETEPENRISQRVLQKCGFVPLGRMGAEGPRFGKTR